MHKVVNSVIEVYVDNLTTKEWGGKALVNNNNNNSYINDHARHHSKQFCMHYLIICFCFWNFSLSWAPSLYQRIFISAFRTFDLFCFMTWTVLFDQRESLQPPGSFRTGCLYSVYNKRKLFISLFTVSPLLSPWFHRLLLSGSAPRMLLCSNRLNGVKM